MKFNPKLSGFFLCVTIFLVAVISFIAYAVRKNAPSNLMETRNGEWHSTLWNNENDPFRKSQVTDQKDISAPYYANMPEHFNEEHGEHEGGEGHEAKGHGSDPHITNEPGSHGSEHGHEGAMPEHQSTPHDIQENNSEAPAHNEHH